MRILVAAIPVPGLPKDAKRMSSGAAGVILVLAPALPRCARATSGDLDEIVVLLVLPNGKLAAATVNNLGAATPYLGGEAGGRVRHRGECARGLHRRPRGADYEIIAWPAFFLLI